MIKIYFQKYLAIFKWLYVNPSNSKPGNNKIVLPDGGGGGCFPSTAIVNLHSGKMVTMSELQKEDQVRTGTLYKEEYILTLFT